MSHDALRILDANFNRAREALRVIEDYARFVLNDAGICESAKRMRHDLAAGFRVPPFDSSIIMRDTPGDVGTSVQTDAEYDRKNTADIAVAAGKRLSEALRVLEEFAKPLSRETAVQIERIRYAGYELEKRVAHVVRAKDRFKDVRLYVLLTESLCARSWRDTLSAVIDGGADCVQFREKDMTDAVLLERAQIVCEACRSAGVVSIINDRVDIAAMCQADGVHLGQTDVAPWAARRILGPNAIIGASSHNVEEAQRAVDQHADYIAVGPMFATPVKPEYGVNGPALIDCVREITSLPLVAIGGITADNVRQVVDAGTDCVAVCTAVIGADDPSEQVRRIRGAVGF